MPLYLVRVRDGGALLPDDGEAQEFATLDDVRREAIESARQILSEAALNGTAASLDVQIEVMNEQGNMVMTVPVGRAVGTETQR
jgi:Domain of unknown function (DUF6894)